MESEEVKMLADKFFDKVISKNEEQLLFDELARNEEVREYFKRLNFLREYIHNDTEEFPKELEKRIFESLGKKKKTLSARNIFTVTSYALSIILIIISLILFNRVNTYKDEVKNAVEAVKTQNNTLQLLLNNTLPIAEVKANFGPEVIIKSKNL
jgi:hypothetical protein